MVTQSTRNSPADVDPVPHDGARATTFRAQIGDRRELGVGHDAVETAGQRREIHVPPGILAERAETTAHCERRPLSRLGRLAIRIAEGAHPSAAEIAVEIEPLER